MTKPMTTTRVKAKARSSGREAVRKKLDVSYPQAGAEHPLEKILGAFKDGPMVDAMLDNIRGPRRGQEPMEEVGSRVLASVRNTIRTLPPERYDEIFGDFAEAVEQRNIGHLADAIANWALGEQGSKTAGAVVNRSLDHLLPLEDDPELLAAWLEAKSTEPQDVVNGSNRDDLENSGRDAQREPKENSAGGTSSVLIRDLPVGRLAGKYKDDPVFIAIMDEIHAATEAELSMLNESE